MMGRRISGTAIVWICWWLSGFSFGGDVERAAAEPPVLASPQPQWLGGVIVAVVTNTRDPDHVGRIQVRLPGSKRAEERFWARVTMLMEKNGRGAGLLPEVGNEVLVAFDQSDSRDGYVLGTLWNGDEAPRRSQSECDNGVHVIESRSGHLVKVSNEPSNEKIEIVDKSGKNGVVFDTASNTLRVFADRDITLASPHGTIRLEAQKIEIHSSTDVEIKAEAHMLIKANETLKMDAAAVGIGDTLFR